jgi:hypothetical protein
MTLTLDLIRVKERNANKDNCSNEQRNFPFLFVRVEVHKSQTNITILRIVH